MVTSFISPRGSPVLQPERMRTEPVRSERLSRMTVWAIIAAALFHIALLVWLWFFSDLVFYEPPPPPVPVKVVYEEPPPPPPPPLPAPKPPPPQQAPAPQPQKPLSYRESGKDLETKALKPADTVGPQEEPPPNQGAATETAAKDKPEPAPEVPPDLQSLPMPVLPPVPDGAEKPKETVARHEPQRKPAHEARAPQVAMPRPPGIEYGEKAMSGDPYLNKVQAMIDRETFYPAQAVPLGIQGSVSFEITLGRMGELLSIAIVKSSGASILDDAAIQILRRASPFPPLPDDYPSPAVLKGGLPFYPRASPNG
jgi:protein TonB